MAAVPRNVFVYCEDGEDDDITTLLPKRARNCIDKRMPLNERPLPYRTSWRAPLPGSSSNASTS